MAQVRTIVVVVAIVSIMAVECHWTKVQSSVVDRLATDNHEIQPVLDSSDQNSIAEESCPPWFIHNNAFGCICGKSLVGIADCCSDTLNIPCFQNASVMTYPCSCITVDTTTNVTYAGYCPYTCFTYAKWNANPHILNNSTCSPWKRAGRLCEECQKDYGIPLFSYSLHCTECSTTSLLRNALLTVVYFISLTVFCFVIIVFRISATAHPFGTFVLISQVYAAPFLLQALSKYPYTILWISYEVFYGIWNLNIFRPLYTSLCMSPALNNIQAALLEYAIGLYPLLFLGIIFIVVKVHDYGYHSTFCDCYPIRRFLVRFRRKFNIHASLTDAFSTFIVLSYIKIGYTSMFILVPTQVYNPDGNFTWCSYAQPSMKYFGRDHAPYALVAVMASLVFCVLPFIILLLYPMKYFHKCLNSCGCRCLTLHAFADTFHGCYKDGTGGSRDYRWFASMYLLTRFGIVGLFCLIKNFYIFSLLASLVSFILVAIIALLKPYKQELNTKIDIVLLFGMGTFFFGLNLVALVEHVIPHLRVGMHIMVCVGASIPGLYIVGVILQWLLRKYLKVWFRKIFPHCPNELTPLLQRD